MNQTKFPPGFDDWWLGITGKYKRAPYMGELVNWGIKQGKLEAAFNWIEKYSEGGELCLDCRHSELAFGSGHTCIVDNHDDCPALPVFLIVKDRGEES